MQAGPQTPDSGVDTPRVQAEHNERTGDSHDSVHCAPCQDEIDSKEYNEKL